MNRIARLIIVFSTLVAACRPDGSPPDVNTPAELEQAGLVSGQPCNDGNSNPNDGCHNGVVQPGYTCFQMIGQLRCDRCGNGVDSLAPDEECDDGNTTSGDGCSSTCTVETGWTCPSTTGQCRRCGDGIVQNGEACDDHALVNGDGCTSTCTLEPGWTCSGSPSACLTSCGDGIRAGAEACDDVNFRNSDERPDACRTDCTLHRCGDGVEDNTPDEFCDDGAWNGLPGLCNTTCTGVMPEEVDALSHTLDAAPIGVVGLLLSDSFLLSMCVDVDVGEFTARDTWLGNHDFIAGRMVTLTQDTVFRHPLLVVDSPAAFDGEMMYTAFSTEVEPLYGDYFAPSGSRVMMALFGGIGVAQCCGTPRLGCALDGLQPGGNGSPICGNSYERKDAPGLVGVTCPDWDAARSKLFDLGDGSAAINASCGSACFVAGGANCNVPSPPPPDQVHGDCGPSDVSIARQCQVMSGAGACPGFCERSPDAFCGILDGDPSGPIGECDMVISEPGECASKFEHDSSPDDPTSLASMWQLCQANVAASLACGFGVEPPGHDDDIEMLVCGQRDSDGSSVCEACSTALGRGCLPTVDVPNDIDGGSEVRLDLNPTAFPSSPGTASAAWLRAPNPKMQAKGADPVALGTGELVHAVTDVAYEARGISFTFTRTYRSGALRSGALGPGWTHNFEERVIPVGDAFNREGVPTYCVEALPEIRCLLRTDESGGMALWMLDPVRRTFAPPAGELGSIAVLASAPEEAQHMRDVADLPPLQGLIIEHVSPGGVRRYYDTSGVLVSIVDEMGFGLALTWAQKTTVQADLDGPWSNVEVATLRGPAQHSLESANPVNPLNTLELVEVTDSYGRDFAFDYVSYPVDGGTTRRRLHSITHRGGVLVEFGYDPFSRTNDVYLIGASRQGLLLPNALEAQPTNIQYEYARDIFDDDTGFFAKTSGGHYVDQLADQIDDAMAQTVNQSITCGSGGGAAPVMSPTDGDPCGVRFTPEPKPRMTTSTLSSLWSVIERAAADNLVRIYVDGQIELETQYEVNPFSASFDHVIQQRYGQVAAETAPQEDESPNGFVRHTWLTSMPSSTLEYLAGNTAVPGGPTLPPASFNTPVEDGPEPPPACHFPSLDLIPFFYPEKAAGDRSDFLSGPVPELQASALPCAAIAASHVREVDSAGLWHNHGAITRHDRTYDLNVICSWVKETDRRGAVHWHGLNFEGAALIELHPSPANPGVLAETRRRVNADGFVVQEIHPDGGTVDLTYGVFDRLQRNLPTTMVETAATASHLLVAKTEQLSGTTTDLTTKTTTFTWDPLFQQPLATTGPDGVTTTWRYDWQQQGPLSPLARRLSGQAQRHGTLIPFPSPFLGVDLDGDGDTAAEQSAGEVLRFVENVDLGGSTIRDVGARTTRDETGRVTDTWSIVDVDNAAQDFNRTGYRYYENLAKAEAGDLTIGACRKPCGPLGELTRFRTRTSTAANDLDVTFFAYDALGGVRLTRENGDTTTDVVAVRDGLGRIVDETHPGGRTVHRDVDAHGRPIREEQSGASAIPIVTSWAWGLGETQLGVCREIDDGACDLFQDFALNVFDAVRSNTSLPSPLPDADYDVVVVDAEDGEIGRVGPFGVDVTTVRSLAGVPTKITTEASADQVQNLGWDVGGRLLSASVGSASSAEMKTLYAWDRFGRQVAVQTHQALATTAFTAGTGTIQAVGFDAADRVVRASVEGADGSGNRRILSLQREELNAIGLSRFTHTYTGSLQTSLVGKSASGVSSSDSFATESLKWDSAQRIVNVTREGITETWGASYDHFGPKGLASPTIKTGTITTTPKTRTTTRALTWRADGTGAVNKTATTTEVRDARGLVTSQTWSDTDTNVNRSNTFQYDGLGRLVKATDASGRLTIRSYGSLSRLIQVEEANGRTTTYHHDERGRLISRDPSDAPEQTWDYDNAGQLTFEQSGDLSTSYVYDTAGRLEDRIHVVRGNSRTTHFKYSGNVAAPFLVTIAGADAKGWSRDGLDRPVIATDFNLAISSDVPSGFDVSRPAVSTALTFDTAGRVAVDETIGKFPATSPTLPNQNAVPLAKVTTSWPKTFLGPDGLTLRSTETRSFTYSGNGLVSNVRHVGLDGKTLDVELSWEGGRHVRTKINGNVTTRERDGLGAVRATTMVTNTGTETFNENVIRGPSGLVTSRLTNAKLLVTRAHGHTYDAIARLKQTKVDMTSTMNLTTFRGFYDDAAASETFAPLTSIDATVTNTLGGADTVTAASADERGRVHAASFDPLEAGVPPEVVNSKSLARDTRDRIQSDTQLSYSFDAFDRLVLVKRGSTEELRVAYDGLGRRRLERRLEGATSPAVVDLVFEYHQGNVIEERTPHASIFNKIFSSTVHVPGELDAPLVAIDGPHVAGGKRYALGTAVRGDVTSVVNLDTGDIVEQQLLDTWGEREAIKNGGSLCIEGKESASSSLPQQTCVLSVLQRFGIGGAREHARTKLVDLRNRVYATHLHGFLSKDPLGSIDSDGQWNYVVADPINLKDPLGLGSKTASGGDVHVDTNANGDEQVVWDEEPAPVPPATSTPAPAGVGADGFNWVVCDLKCRRKEAADARAAAHEPDLGALFDTDPERNGSAHPNPPIRATDRAIRLIQEDAPGGIDDMAPWEIYSLLRSMPGLFNGIRSALQKLRGLAKASPGEAHLATRGAQLAEDLAKQELRHPTPPIINPHKAAEDATRLWGRSADEIAKTFNDAGYGTVVRQSTRGSQRSTIIEISGHSSIGQIQVHPGGGIHGGAYVKISTNKGIIKVVDHDYLVLPGEKATLWPAPW